MKEQQEVIIRAIESYLFRVMTYDNSLTKIQFERTCVNGASEFIEQEAERITAAIAPHLPPPPKFHNPSEYPTRVEGEEFSVDVFILDETGVHGIAFWNFDDKVWRFHTDTLVDYNEPNAETKWKWYYPPYDLNQVFNR